MSGEKAVETTETTETTEFEGERYGDSEREILDYIFQASDEDLDKLKQLKKDLKKPGTKLRKRDKLK